MNNDKRLITVYREAEKYLFHSVGRVTVKKELEYYLNRPEKIKTLNQVFRRMVESLKNKQGHFNYIADTGDMKSLLYAYDPKMVMKRYINWEQLFRDFKKQFGKHYKMDMENKRNAWVIFSKGVISCAEFLSRFKTYDDFDIFVKTFTNNDLTVVALPLLLEKEIFGYGFPLACDMLKEIGYCEYAKPDTHLKDIFSELNLSDTDKDYDVFKAVVKMAKLVKQFPVIVDKIFWLIGSGKFRQSNIQIKSGKKEFIEQMKHGLRLKGTSALK